MADGHGGDHLGHGGKCVGQARQGEDIELFRNYGNGLFGEPFGRDEIIMVSLVNMLFRPDMESILNVLDIMCNGYGVCGEHFGHDDGMCGQCVGQDRHGKRNECSLYYIRHVW